MRADKLLKVLAEAERRQVKELNLGSQNIDVLPPEIGRLRSLQSLNLVWNNLTRLPVELSECENLTVLRLEGNPLLFPSPSIMEQGTKAILAFLRAGRSERTRQWVSKLLIVGEGGVGKTQLLRHLRHQAFDPSIETTHGIEIHTCSLPHPTEQAIMSLNAWDFGGQQIYHATHQFFLTDRSLFLLAWNARTGYEQGKLRYWLETISALAPDAPILLVATHTDQREADVPLAELRSRFPQLAGQVEISNATGEGVAELRARVARLAATLPLMGEEWPTHWLRAAEHLRRLPDKYLKPAQLAEIFARYNVTGHDLQVLVQWLHDLGDILQYSDDELRDIIIVKPQWVAEHIGRVLVHPPVIDNAGIFKHQDMEAVWHDLDDGMRQHFLRLMERFDLSYRTLENRELSLVVERLPLEAADYRRSWDEVLGSNLRELAMIYRMSAVPAGIPTWFIARQHRFTTYTHWRSGALFADGNRSHKALITVDSHERVAELRVRGSHPHDFFALLRDGFELTLSRFPGLQVKRLVPCPGHDGARCSHLFDYANLLHAIDRTPPVMSLQCPVSFESVSVAGLLFGIHWETRDVVIEKIEAAKTALTTELQDATAKVINEVSSGLERNITLIQREFLKMFHREQRLVETHCPNVFSITPTTRGGWRKVVGDRVLLKLYCQAPGAWHPTEQGGEYVFTVQHQWLRAAMPYLTGLIGVLKLAVPLVGPAIGVVDASQAKRLEYDTKLMEKLVEALPADFKSVVTAHEITAQGASAGQLSGASLRPLRQLLEELDPRQTWGGLTPVLTPEGHLLWLCDNHNRAYQV
ncbi:hypothetical protein Lesp02_57740 [Lentzea sp. NBRC 105346]|uniref:COR domain-containing protein n=1 Tax=Lentzea sp. NBRC 105346 TaxID=3032205 RepID=UPI0024A169A6|nr:COR domain-containing protein [Lentzea sp. NBRC 105346]GLZ33586.1 hypothetical protein Lesp02_57740 [Lentzea sp. NBRC 105346]